MLTIGNIVKFNPKVYDERYTPYYDDYSGHVFKIINLHIDDDYQTITHYELICLSGDVTVNGYVHESDLELIS